MMGEEEEGSQEEVRRKEEDESEAGKSHLSFNFKMFEREASCCRLSVLNESCSEGL